MSIAVVTLSVAGIPIGGLGSIIAGLFGAVAAVYGYMNKKKIQQVHVMVNSNLERVMKRLDMEVDRTGQLKDTLTAHGVDIPVRKLEDLDAIPPVPVPGVVVSRDKLNTDPEGKSDAST